jgi:predicted metalloprotease with PDZ domain
MRLARVAIACVLLWSNCALLAVTSTPQGAHKNFGANPAAPRITLSLDATEASRRIFHARLTIPATPGMLTVYYPKWIPGEHGPTGPIQNLTGLTFKANGQPLKWRRDLLDGWTFHVEVPAGVSSVEASLDFVSAEASSGLHTGRPSATDRLAVINWNTVLLYPAGSASDQLMYEVTLRLPAGWKLGTSLPVATQDGEEIKLARKLLS